MKRIIIENALMLFVEDLKCEHVVKNDVEWVVDLATFHHIIPTKGLFSFPPYDIEWVVDSAPNSNIWKDLWNAYYLPEKFLSFMWKILHGA